MGARRAAESIVKSELLPSPMGKNGLIEKILELTFQANTNIGTVSEESRTPTRPA